MLTVMPSSIRPFPAASALMLALALAGCAATPASQSDGSAPARPRRSAPVAPAPTLGGAVIDPSLPIADNIAKAPNLTTLVGALQAAGLDQTLRQAGPYTLLAPTNDAFGRLAPGTIDALLKPENRPSLAKVLDYLILAGRIDTATLRQQIGAGGGSTQIRTLEGDALTVTLTGAVITLTDVNNNRSYIQTGDVPQQNGLVQVVNGVLIPDLG
jgi:uncharacterized surface protein with fasciclin (FAS1) repeats